MTDNIPVIAPFRGIRYAMDRISHIRSVVTPPYDVIDGKMQAEYYAKDPHNIIRLDLNREEGDGKYQEARHCLLDWLEKGVLKRDEKPAFYLHEQSFTVSEQSYTRKGFIALRRLEAFGEGSIKPHERTLDGPKEDRFKLSKACSAHLSQIFGLYTDPKREVEAFFEGVRAGQPLLDFVAEDGNRHRFWICTDPIIFREVDRILSTQSIFIADGHHRYETSLRYSEFLRQGRNDFSGDETLFYTMMYLTHLGDPGLLILPIHRLVHALSGFEKNMFLEKLHSYFDIEKLAGLSLAEMQKRLNAYVMDYHAYLFAFSPDEFYLVRKRRDQLQSSEDLAHIDPVLRQLDVLVLHTLVFEKILGLSVESQARQENIGYVKDLQSVAAELARGTEQMAIVMNRTAIDEMQQVADKGFKMPQKSTFFYPKLLTGLVINPIVPTERIDV